MVRKSMFLLVLASLVLGLAACSGAAARQPTEIKVTLTDFKVQMSSVNLPAGVPVKITVTNAGSATHELVLEKAGANDEPELIEGKEAELEDIAPGETKTATWVIKDPGKYQFSCHVSGHFEAGMVEGFTVQ